MHILKKITKNKTYTDAEMVLGLQAHDHRVEEGFYTEAKNYFMVHFKECFFDEDRRQEIFQDSVLRLWTEMENGRICIGADGSVERQQSDGTYTKMTATLWTFLMAIASNTYREVLRQNKEQYYGNLFDLKPLNGEMERDAEEIQQDQLRVIDECISEMPPRCIEVLTLFYHEGKSLDEIMELRGGKNESKVGLKTAKYKCMTALKQRVAQRLCIT